MNSVGPGTSSCGTPRLVLHLILIILQMSVGFVCYLGYNLSKSKTMHFIPIISINYF